MKKSQLLYLNISQLKPGRFQPRKRFAQESLQELADSIQAQGLIQPIVVRPLSSGGYEIIAGERRWRAAQLVQIHELPCLVMDINDADTAAITTIENIQRQDLNPVEEANAYQRLITDFGYTHDEIAVIVGKARTKISNMLRLLRLDSRVQQFLVDGQIDEGHGKVLAGLSLPEQYELATKVIDQQWSVRKLEQVIKKLESGVPSKAESASIHVKRLERNLSDQVGTEVKIEVSAREQRGGWLSLRYFDNDTLSGLIQRMGLKEEIDG